MNDLQDIKETMEIHIIEVDRYTGYIRFHPKKRKKFEQHKTPRITT